MNLDLYIKCHEEFLINAGKETIKILFNEINLIDIECENIDEGICLEISTANVNIKPQIKFTLLSFNRANNIKKSLLDIELEENIYNSDEIHNQLKRMAKLGVYKILSQYLKKQPVPWGILTGIRPTKIVHRLIDQGWSESEIIIFLVNCYAVKKEKASLLTKVAFRQRKYLLNEVGARKLVSIYIGIPFCPTRCAYCSFPAFSLTKWGKLVEPYLEALLNEIRKTGEILRKFSLKVETIYFGGGTPTSLTAIQLERIINLVKTELISEVTKEFTVEAGRPDTITKEVLKVLKDGGVNRLSINPQSMQGKTLAAIGRAHTPNDVIEKVQLARAMGFDNINMDIIIGLPGENTSDVQSTMDEIKKLNPENLTVHTMAIKRASKLKEERENYILPVDFDVTEMFKITQKAAEEITMHPYYLYRQKQILGQLENIGYAKEGYDCLYNIQMMEERQTILGLGVGSGSKFIHPGVWTLESTYNPKDIINYIERIDELINRKEQMLSNSITL